MYLLILSLPLIGSLIAGFFVNYLGRSLSTFLVIFCSLLSAFISLFIFYEICLCNSIVSLFFFFWISLGLIEIPLSFLFDNLTGFMLIVVTWVSFFVHLYSLGYMSHDPYLPRFISYLSLFTFFMLILVSSDNFIFMFVGWEGVGVCSYLLIGFWYTRILANKAALKAMVMNRVADVFFILAIVLIILIFRAVDYLLVFNLVPLFKNTNYFFCYWSINIMSLISFFLFVGCVGKSAQIGLHTWLPDAMEGPTPVSSLLHAATMVTAGVFLLLRCNIFFEYSENILLIVSLVGALTAIFAALVSVFQYDIKKVIAYSTCSQLGYMVFSCGLSNYQIAIFHLFNHAFFKALLFLGAGAVIHSLFDEQDMRKMGNLLFCLPLTYACMLIGSMAIIGFPFLAGFYSKDLLLELAYTRYMLDANFIYTLGISTAFITAVYSIRLLIFVFFWNENGSKKLILYGKESEFKMQLSIVFLALFSILIGYIFSEFALGWGVILWSNIFYVQPVHFDYIESEFISPLIKNVPFIFSMLGILFGSLFIYFNHKIFKIKNSYYFFLSKFFFSAGFFNYVYNEIFVFIFKISYLSVTKNLDKGYLEFLGPFGVYKLSKLNYKFFSQYSTPVIFVCLGFIFITFVMFIFLIFVHVQILMFLLLNSGLIPISLIIFFLIINN